MRMRQAVEDDLPLIVQWRQDAAAWLAQQGTDQWSDAGITRDAFAKRVSESIAYGDTWIAETHEGMPLGTIAVNDRADDPGMWHPEA